MAPESILTSTGVISVRCRLATISHTEGTWPKRGELVTVRVPSVGVQLPGSSARSSKVSSTGNDMLVSVTLQYAPPSRTVPSRQKQRQSAWGHGRAQTLGGPSGPLWTQHRDSGFTARYPCGRYLQGLDSVVGRPARPVPAGADPNTAGQQSYCWTLTRGCTGTRSEWAACPEDAAVRVAPMGSRTQREMPSPGFTGATRRIPSRTQAQSRLPQQTRGHELGGAASEVLLVLSP